MQASTKKKARRMVTRRSGIHGKGVFATAAMPRGTRLIEYKGERISPDESLRRYAGATHTFLFQLENNEIIDGGVGGNCARWINHSCDPNCEVIEEDGRVFFDAIRRIRAGEEITFDYNLYLEDRYTPALKREFACNCNASNCRGTLLASKRNAPAPALPDPTTPAGTRRDYINMKRIYWDKIAPVYDEVIFDVLDNDRNATIRSAIEKIASPGKSVIDIGCAVGKWLPVLAPVFGKVYAVDVSAKNLQIARDRQRAHSNVDYIRADMSKKGTALPRADAGICINAILTPSRKDRDVFLHNLGRCIKKGGTLILALPSLESSLLSTLIATRWKVDPGILNKKISAALALKKWNKLREGIVDIEDMPHKHYLREELEILMSQAGFKVSAIQKIEYDWRTEFRKPPKWLKKPGPWSWMLVATRI